MKLPMKLLRIAGLCLVAMLVMSMVAAVSASAEVPAWEHCTKGVVGSAPPTKYESNQCSTINNSTGEWNWREVNGTEPVVSHGSLVLRDTDTIAGIPVAVSCSGEDEGFVGPKKFDRITKITNIKCSNVENCNTADSITAEAVHLPWQTELVKEGTETRDKITKTTEAPGWAVKCTVDGLPAEDRCTNETGSTKVENKHTPGVKGELLVLADFEPTTPKAECTMGAGNKLTGEVLGTVANLQANGAGLQIN